MPTSQLPGETTERRWLGQTQLLIHCASEHHRCLITGVSSPCPPSGFDQQPTPRRKSCEGSVGLVRQPPAPPKLWMDGLKSERASVGGSVLRNKNRNRFPEWVTWPVLGWVTDHWRRRGGPASTCFVEQKFKVERQPEETNNPKERACACWKLLLFTTRRTAKDTASQPIRMERTTKKSSVVLWLWKESQQRFQNKWPPVVQAIVGF